MGNLFCLGQVDKSTVAIKETFGKFDDVLEPGLHCVPCIYGSRVAGQLTLRLQRLDVKCETKTKDNVFVNVVASIRYRALSDKASKAFYKFSNTRSEIQAYVFDVIRASVPKLNLDDAFEQKKEIAKAVEDELEKAMSADRFEIVQTLIVDIKPDKHVKRAMNEINADKIIFGLGECCRDLLKQAKTDVPVVGRDKELKQMISILSCHGKSNLILVGDPGVGKTALVECLAQKIVKGDVPEGLKNARLVSLNVGTLLKYRGEFETKFERFMKEVEQGGVIVFIDEIHLVIGAGKIEESNIDFANLLKPYLGRKGSKFIGATTMEEYNKYICSDPTFERRFQKVDVNEPNNIDATNILRGLKNVFETKYRVEITDAALIAAVEYSSRYMTERKLPDKAIELLHEACTVLKLQLDSHPDVISDLHDKIENLKLQSRALRRESDPASKARYVEVIKEIDASEREVQALLARYKGERTKLEDLHFHREYREKFYVEYEKLANKECAEGLELMRKIGIGNERMKEIEGSMMLVDKVGPNEIAKAVSRRTGIPVTKIGADKLNEKVIGQEQAVGPIVSTCSWKV